MGIIRPGCSGWDYRDWADVFYKNTDESKLRAYSCVFSTAEINSTFYRYPSDIAYVRWHGRGKKMWNNYRYSKDELAAWVPNVKEMSQKAEVYGFFNNHYHGYAPRTA